MPFGETAPGCISTHESADPIDFLEKMGLDREHTGYGAIGFKICAEYVRTQSTDGSALDQPKEE